MAETDRHRNLMFALMELLEDRFATRPDAYVSGDLLLFYEEGNKRRHVAPDVFVVFGVPKRERDNYLLWEEGRGPSVVIEVTSSSTRREDTRRKFDLYRDVLRVSEYFLYDPRADYLDPRLQGYRLTAGTYRAIRPTDGRLRSRQLGLLLEPGGETLWLVDPATGNRLASRAERLEAESAARRAAEDELERVRTELAALRKRPNGRNGH
jgi:Uma2 family endonuclease